MAGAVPAGGPGGPSGLGSGYRLDNATGAVPGARLSVIDISTAGGGLTVPSPMDQTLLQVRGSAGRGRGGGGRVRVWRSGCGGQDVSCHM